METDLAIVAVFGDHDALLALLDSNRSDAPTQLQKNEAFFLASSYNKLEVVKSLLQHGASVNTFDRVSLFTACRNNHVEMVKLLLQHGAKLPKYLRSITDIFMPTLEPIPLGIIRNESIRRTIPKESISKELEIVDELLCISVISGFLASIENEKWLDADTMGFQFSIVK